MTKSRDLDEPTLLASEFVLSMRGLLRHLEQRRKRLDETAQQLDATADAVRAYLRSFEQDWTWRENARRMPLEKLAEAEPKKGGGLSLNGSVRSTRKARKP